MYHCDGCGLSTSHPLVVREQVCPACGAEYYIRNWGAETCVSGRHGIHIPVPGELRQP
jgi:hypothetical protein